MEEEKKVLIIVRVNTCLGLLQPGVSPLRLEAVLDFMFLLVWALQNNTLFPVWLGSYSSTKKVSNAFMQQWSAPLPISTSSRSLLADHTYHALRAAIFKGELAPGTPLRENEIAARIGVSRTPVREALRRLLLECLVTKTQSGGVIVSEVTSQLIIEAFALRKLLEGYAAREAATIVTPDDITRLHAIIAEAEHAVQTGASEQLPELNDQFHGYIENIAHNSLLTRTTHMLREQTVAYRAFALGRPAQQQSFVDDHRALLTALAAHDPARAEVLAIEHLEHAMELLLTRHPEV